MFDNWFQRLCRKLTDHRFRKGTAWSEGIEPIEFHYKCLICGKHFWNYTPHKLYLKSIKKSVLTMPNDSIFDLLTEKEKARAKRKGLMSIKLDRFLDKLSISEKLADMIRDIYWRC